MKKLMEIWLNSNANDYVKGVVYGIMVCHRDDPYAKWGYAQHEYKEGDLKTTLLRVNGEEDKLIACKELIEDLYGERFVDHIDITDLDE